MCDFISEYYGFTVYIKKIESIISIKLKEN
nr:MAG TPA: hypothetical protein [Caudoviricetes sp.]